MDILEIKSVDDLNSLSREAFEADFFKPSQPVVLRRAVTDWPAFRLWTRDYLLERVGNKPVTVSVSERKRFDYNADESSGGPRFVEMPFGEAVALIDTAPSESGKYYLQQRPIHKDFPEIAQDIGDPRWFCPPDTRRVVNFWYGGGSAVSPLHYDLTNNFNAQISGSKRWLLYAPSDFENLYPNIAGKLPHVSMADPEQPDLVRFPNLAKAKPLVCDVHAGDLLYLPPFWWHQVRSLETGISINFWWRPNLVQCVGPAPMLMLIPKVQGLKGPADLGRAVDISGFDGFVAIARFFLDHGQYWIAGLMAGTAVEQHLEQLCKQNGLMVREGPASKRIALLNGALTGAGIASQVPARDLAAWSRLLVRAQTMDNSLLTRSDTAALVDGIGHFIESHPLTAMP